MQKVIGSIITVLGCFALLHHYFELRKESENKDAIIADLKKEVRNKTKEASSE